jgi:hypothetical protein
MTNFIYELRRICAEHGYELTPQEVAESVDDAIQRVKERQEKENE